MSTQTNIRGTDTCPAVSELANKRCRTKPPQPVIWLPDENDRHVLAAALAAEASVLCTANIKDFPTDTVSALGIEVHTPDQLLSQLVTEYEPQMLAAHHAAVASLPGATDASTIAALRKASAPTTADLMTPLLSLHR